MSHYLIIGKSFGRLEESITSSGDTFTLFLDKTIPIDSNKSVEDYLVADFSSKESILRELKNIPQKPDGVITIYENYVLPAAWVSKQLGLPGLPIDAAKACTDKYLMREKFSSLDESIGPAFSEPTSLDDAVSFANTYSYPVILKPANLAKSLLVTKCSDEAELRKNYQDVQSQIQEVYAKYAPHAQPKLIIEQYMEGSVHSLDAFADTEGKVHLLDDIVDYQTGYDIGYDDNFHYSRILPSKLNEEDQKAIKHVALLGMQALGIKNSPAHIELILTANGPRIVEIGARNGGYRSRMHSLANGIDLAKAALEVSKGKTPHIEKQKNECCAVLELFPRKNGFFRGIHSEEELRQLRSLHYVSIKAKPGQKVGRSSAGYKMCAVIILHHSDKRTFTEDLAFVNNNVYVEITDSK